MRKALTRLQSSLKVLEIELEKPSRTQSPSYGAVRPGALAKSIIGYHKNMVRKQCPVLELANQMPVRNMDLARAPRRTACKKGSGYENAREIA